MKNVLVLGGAGFIGAALIRRLLADNTPETTPETINITANNTKYHVRPKFIR